MNQFMCDLECSCEINHEPIQLIVLTGGPGAGKTAILEYVKKIFCKHVAILPEAASLLFGGGFWRLNSVSAKKAEQRAIYYVQREFEKMVIDENQWILGLCDRGTLDSLAYWPGDEDEFFKALSTSKEKEYQKYKAVIQVATPNIKNGYNHQNPIRIETAEEALKIDKRIHEIWKGHPHYTFINSSDHFIDKVRLTEKIIRSLAQDICNQHIHCLKQT